jgi:hypothetical protein
MQAFEQFGRVVNDDAQDVGGVHKLCVTVESAYGYIVRLEGVLDLGVVSEDEGAGGVAEWNDV